MFLAPILELVTWVASCRASRCRSGAGSSVNDAACRPAPAARTLRPADTKASDRAPVRTHPRLALPRPEDAQELVTGSEVVVHYDVRHPARWGLGPPRHDNTVLILG